MKITAFSRLGINAMRKILIGAGLFLAGSIGTAQAADEWGIEYEEKSRVEAKVVDIQCEVAGICTDNCGNGKHQLGLLLDDGRLVPVVKNKEPFAGATNDLIKFCNKRVVADGLMIKNPKMPMFVLQFKKLANCGKWSGATQFGKDWSKANGGKDASQWFRNDATIAAIIKKDGVFGIPGLEPEKE